MEETMQRTDRRSRLALATALAFLGLMAASTQARAEPFSTLYLGLAVTSDAPYLLDGQPAPPALTCITSCSSALSPVGGIRIGYWFERLPWLGVAGDFSAFIAGYGFESPAEVLAYPLTPLVAVRGRLLKQEGYEHGRVQPYFAIGPSMFITSATVSSGYAIIGTSSKASDLDLAIGLDGRLGVEILTAPWFGINLEYRYTYSKPSWEIEGVEIETEYSTSHWIVGITAHY